MKCLLILQAYRHFTYVTAYSPTLPSLYLRHSSFSNPSVASSTSQLILQPFFRFSYVTGSSPYVTWRAAHELHGSNTHIIRVNVHHSLFLMFYLYSYTSLLEDLSENLVKSHGKSVKTALIRDNQRSYI